MRSRTIPKALFMIVAGALGISIGNVVHSAVKGRRSSAVETVSISFPGMKKTDVLVSPKPGVLIVNAQANIMKKIRTEKLKWFLIVRHPEPHVVSGRTVYDQQAFQVQSGSNSHPTFKEEIQVPAGRYLVTVGLKKMGVVRYEDGSVEDDTGLSVCASSFYEDVKGQVEE
jgi:hypothetical protein